MSNSIDRLIYLDSGFIAAKYEEDTGKSPPTQMARVEGMSAGAKAFVFSAGIHTQETRTYKISAQAMWQTVSPALEKYPTLDPQSFANYRGTMVCWLEGLFTMGVWKEGETESEGFELLAHNDRKRIALLLNPLYLSAGFDAIVQAADVLKNNIGIPARILARVMWHVDNANTLVACPYVIVENGM